MFLIKVTKLDKTVKFSYSIDDFITFHGDKKFPLSQPEPNEFCWFCPRELGFGRFQRIKIRPGFDLWLSDCTFYQDLVCNHCKMPVAMQFSFTLSGNCHVCYKNWKKPVQYCGEYQGIGYHNESCSTCRIVRNIPLRYVSMTFFPKIFAACFEEHLHLFPPLIHNMLADKAHNGYLYQSSITPAMRDVVQQIIRCPFHGITRKLFLESRSLELLSLQLEQITASSPSCHLFIRMHPHDKKQIQVIRDILDSNMETPPTLKELARIAGMSHPKLNRCFKQIYGMTVFQYLRTERLNKAKTMLQKEGYSVTETAFQVGYDSVSHFSQIYKKQFGISPSRAL